MSAWSTPELPIVSTDWLFEHLNSPDVHVIDASWHMPNSGRNARAEYNDCHIEGAVFFDIDEISDSNTTLPHMMPSPEKFASRVRSLGLGDGIKIVVYDSNGIFSAPRVWWMFRHMGHDDVVVLDGGLKKWLAEGKPCEDMPPIKRDRHYSIRVRHDLIKDFNQTLAISQNGNAQIIDARSPTRFSGEEMEPRAGLNSGHIPNSINLHYAKLLNEDGTFKNIAELEKIFVQNGVDIKAPLVASCGSGITACILALGAYLIGNQNVAIYDGSWAQWGSRDDAPIESIAFETT
jgi:thiosulfate/3-mercaptopyruvate sulfurtransferase